MVELKKSELDVCLEAEMADGLIEREVDVFVTLQLLSPTGL